MEGVRQKALIDNGKRLRMVEYFPNMPQHWCEKGHFGYVLEGRLEIEFDGGAHLFKEGDGVFIPDGAGTQAQSQGAVRGRQSDLCGRCLNRVSGKDI